MDLDPGIFKAYDVRGVYPREINEDAARAIGAAFIAYLKAKRIAVGRDMRLSSPALAAAFIDGATSQGADVVDYGMIATDMLYFAVASDALEGGVQVTFDLVMEVRDAPKPACVAQVVYRYYR